MEEDSNHNVPLQANSAQEAASGIDDRTMHDQIIQNINAIVSSTDADTAAKTNFISYYVRVKYQEFSQTGYVREIEDAIEKQRVVLSLTKQDDKSLGRELNLLGVLLELRYERLGGVEDLADAIERAEEAVRVTPVDHPDLAGYLTNLGNKLESRYRLTGQIADLEKAIKQAEEVVRVTPGDHPDLAMFLNNIGTKLTSRYERTGQIADLEKAIEKTEEAVCTSPVNHPNLAMYLSNLGLTLRRRYERTGQIADLEKAIEKTEEAVRVTPVDHPDLAVRLTNLGSILESRYERTRRLADLEKAIEKTEEAVKVTPVDDPDLAIYLSNLGSTFGRRYERTGLMADLEKAIKRTEEAVIMTPVNHLDLALYLNNLGSKLESRYERTRQMADLEKAIESSEEAVRVTPVNHPDLAMYLNNLGSKLESRYERTEQMADLEKAIESSEEAVRVTPVDNPDLAGYLNNLGNKLESRYKRTGQIADLEKAIKQAEEVVRVTPGDHPDLAACLNNLGNKLRKWYKWTGQMADLEKAIEKAEEAVRVTPVDHPDLAMYLQNLGQSQKLSPEFLQADNALSSFLRSWHCHSGIPSHRLRSAVAAIDLLISKQHWPQAADLAVEAINLLPQMNRRMLSRDDQQHILSMFTGLASKACSLSLYSGRPVESSIEVLEQGRGAILGLIIDDRSDISRLYQLFPTEAKEYDRLRREVNTVPSETANTEGRGQMWKRRANVIQELEECIERIRRLPSLERFLLGASTKELQQQAAAGPIVIVNVTNIRSDAIIVTQQQISSFELPSFTAEALWSWRRQELTDFSNATFGKKNKKYRAFLIWIWTSCVQTVVRRVCTSFITSTDAEPELRVWWIGTGEASNVPFHAAGDHAPGSDNNTISHVVSSYTPTIKALAFTRERLAQTGHTVATDTNDTEPRKLCLATMPHTPGASDLSGVSGEFSSIRSAVDATYHIIHLASPTVADVEEQLKMCQIFHFAGHGKADSVDPSQGCLVFQKYDEAGVAQIPDLLRVDDIARLELPCAHLAYLSACSTADNSSTRLADEVIHLVSGFQVAGFPHVIGSMWPSVDQICADVAGLFYQNLCRRDGEMDADGFVAHALQSAVVEIRKQWWMEPLAWAQYVHFGA